MLPGWTISTSYAKSKTMRLVTGDHSSCNNTELGRAWDLNYPSFSVAVEDGKPIKEVSCFWGNRWTAFSLSCFLVWGCIAIAKKGRTLKFCLFDYQPEITAPGVSILASWSPVAPPSVTFTDTPSVNFNVISGTSMSTACQWSCCLRLLILSGHQLLSNLLS
ncbi:Peptidase S8/S53 domain [Dillenia turbinata]|uniref:Peptidase S8/S53 domain n=1 Tax=Dillenia turbinata TaxID=194707 RepID=A0AAN8ZIJ3_9MAGN